MTKLKDFKDEKDREIRNEELQTKKDFQTLAKLADKQFETPEQSVERLRQEEPPEMRRLRYLLAMTFAGSRLYRDDGEYTDSVSHIDFRRDTVSEIERKMGVYNQRHIKDDKEDDQERYECHITIDPILVETKLDELVKIVEPYRFKVAKLFMLKTHLENQKDTFITGHASTLVDMTIRMTNLTHDLKKKGFKVRREKIERIMLDHSYDETKDCLSA